MAEFVVQISTSGYKKTFNSELDAYVFFGAVEWGSIVEGTHSEYCLVEET
jgi:hypothetical protein